MSSMNVRRFLNFEISIDFKSVRSKMMFPALVVTPRYTRDYCELRVGWNFNGIPSFSPGWPATRDYPGSSAKIISAPERGCVADQPQRRLSDEAHPNLPPASLWWSCCDWLSALSRSDRSGVNPCDAQESPIQFSRDKRMKTLDRQKLDVVKTTRNNLAVRGWRGQFTPAFVAFSPN